MRHRTTTRKTAAPILLLLLIITTLANTVSAQIRRPDASQETIDLKVRVVIAETDRPVTMPFRVQLTNSMGVPVQERFSNDQGFAEFTVRPGVYRLKVNSTEATEEVQSDSFTIYAREVARFEYLRVPTKPGKTVSAEGQIDVGELNIPDKARKEFEKGVKALQAEKLDEAQSRFTKAIEIHPKYAAAHNNLGVIAMRKGDPTAGRAAFEKALMINDKFAGANVNMARVFMAEKDYAKAAQFLEKAIATEPSQGEALLLLANAQQQLKNFDSVTALSKKLHSLEHKPFATVHILAGNAFVQLGKNSDAAAEYRLFLKEAPESSFSPKVQEALNNLESAIQASQKQ